MDLLTDLDEDDKDFTPPKLSPFGNELLADGNVAFMRYQSRFPLETTYDNGIETPVSNHSTTHSKFKESGDIPDPVLPSSTLLPAARTFSLDHSLGLKVSSFGKLGPPKRVSIQTPKASLSKDNNGIKENVKTNTKKISPNTSGSSRSTSSSPESLSSAYTYLSVNKNEEGMPAEKNRSSNNSEISGKASLAPYVIQQSCEKGKVQQAMLSGELLESQNQNHKTSPMDQSCVKPPERSPPVSNRETSSQSPECKIEQKRIDPNLVEICGQSYTVEDEIGKGGSSKVYKVRSEVGKHFAMKRVHFENNDPAIVEGFKGEINLLHRLRREKRVVRLYSYELDEDMVHLVMEIGEIDLAHVLAARTVMPLDLSFVHYYSSEIFKCVEAVHKHGIVHSDLKPANFLLVKGMLKIIDFGIANVVPDNTVNVHRELQIGTPNYMSPESLQEVTGSAGATIFKVGKPSDVWSCGCIIYQMIYGKAPYAAFASQHQKIRAILDPLVRVSYPVAGLGGVSVPSAAVDLVAGCLQRDIDRRLTIDQALSTSFFAPNTVTKEFIGVLLDRTIRYIKENGFNRDDIALLTNDAWNKILKDNHKYHQT